MSTISASRPADVRLGPLSLWVHGYEYADAAEFYDANWLRVTTRCSAAGSSVEVSGAILLTSDLEKWREDLARLHESLSGEAILEPPEPNLAVRLRAEALGHIAGEISVTPDPLSQEHRFVFEVDQTYLASALSQLNVLVRQWPVRHRA